MRSRDGKLDECPLEKTKVSWPIVLIAAFPLPPHILSLILSRSTLSSFEHSSHLDGGGFGRWDIPWKLVFAKVLCAAAALPPFCDDSDE